MLVEAVTATQRLFSVFHGRPVSGIESITRSARHRTGPLNFPHGYLTVRTTFVQYVVIHVILGMYLRFLNLFAVLRTIFSLQ
jgi:hypothetical protein